MTATLLIGSELRTISIRNSDLHRGRIMAEDKSNIYRFTRRQDGSYRLKGMTDGILVWDGLVA